MLWLYTIVLCGAMFGGPLVVPALRAAAEPRPVLQQMLTLARDIGGHEFNEQLYALQQQLAALPHPTRGDRQAARPYNAQGVEALKKKA